MRKTEEEKKKSSVCLHVYLLKMQMCNEECMGV